MNSLTESPISYTGVVSGMAPIGYKNTVKESGKKWVEIDAYRAEAVRNGYKVKKHRWGGLPYSYRGLISCAECGCRITFVFI